MADTKIYTWLYDLRDNPLTKDVKEDYMASVHTVRSYTTEDIVQSIVSERTEYRQDTILAIANLIDEKIRQFVCQGNTVTTGSAHFSPSITGPFTGATGVFDSNVNACVVNVSPSKAMRDEVEKVEAEFTGYVKDLGGARIGLVTDSSTGKTDGTITPGGILNVTGNKIKCVNADGSDIGKVMMVNTETEVVTDITSLAVNKPSQLMFGLPITLAEGTYKLRIETYFSSTGIFLKTARTIEYDKDLILSTSAPANTEATPAADVPTAPAGIPADDEGEAE